MRKHWHYAFLLMAAAVTLLGPRVVIVSTLEGSNLPPTTTNLSLPIYLAIDALCLLAFGFFAVRAKRIGSTPKL